MQQDPDEAQRELEEKGVLIVSVDQIPDHYDAKKKLPEMQKVKEEDRGAPALPKKTAEQLEDERVAQRLKPPRSYSLTHNPSPGASGNDEPPILVRSQGADIKLIHKNVMQQLVVCPACKKFNAFGREWCVFRNCGQALEQLPDENEIEVLRVNQDRLYHNVELVLTKKLSGKRPDARQTAMKKINNYVRTLTGYRYGYRNTRDDLIRAGQTELRPGGCLNSLRWYEWGLTDTDDILKVWTFMVELHFAKEQLRIPSDQDYLITKGMPPHVARRTIRPMHLRINPGVMTVEERAAKGLLRTTVKSKTGPDRKQHVEEMKKRGTPVPSDPPIINHPLLTGVLGDHYEVLEGEGADQHYVLRHDTDLGDVRRSNADALGRAPAWSFSDRLIGAHLTPAGVHGGQGRGVMPALRGLAHQVQTPSGKGKGKNKSPASAGPDPDRIRSATGIFPADVFASQTAPLPLLVNLPARPVTGVYGGPRTSYHDFNVPDTYSKSAAPAPPPQQQGNVTYVRTYAAQQVVQQRFVLTPNTGAPPSPSSSSTRRGVTLVPNTAQPSQSGSRSTMSYSSSSSYGAYPTAIARPSVAPHRRPVRDYDTHGDVRDKRERR